MFSQWRRNGNRYSKNFVALEGRSLLIETQDRRSKKKRGKYFIFVSLFVILLSVFVLALFIRNSAWYHEVFDYDAVSLGKFLRKEKLDTGVTEIRSAYFVDENGREVKLEFPVEFWTMIADDFAGLTWGKAIKYRIHSVSQPVNDILITSRRKIIELELVSAKHEEPVFVKIYKEGYVWISLKAEDEFMIGTACIPKYYDEALKFISMEGE